MYRKEYINETLNIDNAHTTVYMLFIYYSYEDHEKYNSLYKLDTS